MVEPQEGMTAEDLVDAAQFAEKCGFGYFFRSDHLLPTSRRRGLDSLECWTTLGAIAAGTRRIRFGPMVSPIGFRNPALLARMACTVNSIARGRLQLGVGAGWYGDEYRAHGYVFPDLRTRRGQFREALEIIRPLTQKGRVTFEGRYFSAHLEGLPIVKRKIHLIIGGRLPSIAGLTATYGDEWNFFAPIPRHFETIKSRLQQSGRHIEISRMGPFVLAETPSRLRTRLRSEMRSEGVSRDEDAHAGVLRRRGWLVGTEKQFPDEINRLRERGVEKFYFQIWNPTKRGRAQLLARVLRQM